MSLPQFADKNTIAELLGIRPGTLKTWRLGRAHTGVQPVLTEGIHWIRLSPKRTIFNVDLLRDFIANQSNPKAHERAIAAYLESLPSSQSSSPKRRRAA